MSYFDDQEDAWFDNDCQGDITDVDPYDDPFDTDALYEEEDEDPQPVFDFIPRGGKKLKNFSFRLNFPLDTTVR